MVASEAFVGVREPDLTTVKARSRFGDFFLRSRGASNVKELCRVRLCFKGR